MLDSLFGDLQPRRLPQAPRPGATDPAAGRADTAVASRSAATDVVVERSPADTLRQHFAAERQAGLPQRPMLTLLDPARLWSGAVLQALSDAGGQPLQRLRLRERATLRTLATIERTLVPRRSAEALRVYHADGRAGGLDGGLDGEALGLALAEASQLCAVIVGALQPHALLALLRTLLDASHGLHWRCADLVFLLPPSAAALGERIRQQPWPAGLRVQVVPEPLGTTAGVWNSVLAAWEAAQRAAAARPQPAATGPADVPAAAPSGTSGPATPRPEALAGTPGPGRAGPAPAGRRPGGRLPSATDDAASADRPADPPLPAPELLGRLLAPLARSEGLLGCGVVDLISGDLLASQSRDALPGDLPALALSLCTARQAHRALGRATSLPDEVLVTAGPHQVLLRTLPGGAALGFVALLDRAQANLPLLRFRLLDTEGLLA